MQATHIRSSKDYKCYLCRKPIRRPGDATTIGRPTRPKTVHIWCKEYRKNTAAPSKGAVPNLPSKAPLFLDSPIAGVADQGGILVGVSVHSFLPIKNGFLPIGGQGTLAVYASPVLCFELPKFEPLSNCGLPSFVIL